MTHNDKVLALLSDGNLSDLLELRPQLFAATKEEERFLTKVRERESGCWEWQGSKNRGNYGMFQYQGSPRLVHRVMHAWFYGPEETESGLHIDHLCRNTLCVNPLHLEAVTQAENNRRAFAGVPGKRGSHCRSGHEFTPENSGRRSDGRGRYCRECSRQSCRRYAARKKAEA